MIAGNRTEQGAIIHHPEFYRRVIVLIQIFVNLTSLVLIMHKYVLGACTLKKFPHIFVICFQEMYYSSVCLTLLMLFAFSFYYYKTFSSVSFRELLEAFI